MEKFRPLLTKSLPLAWQSNVTGAAASENRCGASGSRSPGRWRHQSRPKAIVFQERIMFRIISTLCLPVAACGVAIGLSACAAVPLAQMALSPAPVKMPCATGSSCQTAAAGLPDGLSKSFQNLFGVADADPKDAPPPDPK